MGGGCQGSQSDHSGSLGEMEASNPRQSSQSQAQKGKLQEEEECAGKRGSEIRRHRDLTSGQSKHMGKHVPGRGNSRGKSMRQAHT